MIVSALALLNSSYLIFFLWSSSFKVLGYGAYGQAIFIFSDSVIWGQ
ncbi:hypothetical protein SCG7109_AG_00200 [Chlamydiales bacterium SCGC AG-110-M15]|nr:hypothetical protein SCG7109_AG_00200 [Chlamydiales bacterium SCGC AG-110-M15]